MIFYHIWSKLNFPSIMNITMQHAIVTRSYLRGVINGKHPKMTIPRTPTADAAAAHLKKSIEANWLTIPGYIEREVLDGKDHVLVRSPFPQACDWGLTEYTYWTKYKHDRVDHVRIRVANRLMVRPDDIYIIPGDETVGAPNYQVFVESDPTQIQAPCYELPGSPPKSAREYQAEWSALLGVPVRVSRTLSFNWIPETSMNHGLWITTFRVQRYSDIIGNLIMWFAWFTVFGIAVMFVVFEPYYL